MQKEIIGIFIVTLLIGTAVIPVQSTMNELIRSKESKECPYGLGYIYQGYSTAITVELPEPTGPLPSSFDWRNYNGEDWTTPIRNQGQCGSCWAFGAIGALEAAINIEFNDPDVDMDLSEQYLVSCSPCNGCWGGWANMSFEWMYEMGGALPESCFPYIAENGSCDDKCSDWENYLLPIGNNYWTAVNQSVDVIKQALIDHGPLVADVAVYDDWFEYRGGILVHPLQQGESIKDINHQPVIVGYNDNEQCWIVKNSWGSRWGEDTYDVAGEKGWCRIHYGHYFIGSAIHGVESNIIKGNDTGKPIVELIQPLDGWIYINNNPITTVLFGKTKTIGLINITAEPEDIEIDGEEMSGVDRVEFYVDGVLRFIARKKPYNWEMKKTDRTFGAHEIRVTAYDNAGNPSENKKVDVFTLY